MGDGEKQNLEPGRPDSRPADPFVLILKALIHIGDLAKVVIRVLLTVISKTAVFLRLLTKLIGKFGHQILESAPKLFIASRLTFKRLASIPVRPLSRLIKKRPSLKAEFRPFSIVPTTKSFLFGVLFAFFFLFLPFQVYSWLLKLPHPGLLRLGIAPVTTKIYDRHGYLLYEIYRDENRTPVSLEQIPDHLKLATLAIEDSDFYSHPGFSVKGILRALGKITLEKKVQGGSTITQQLVRSALLTPEQTLNRKTKEILLAFWAERVYSKDEILEMYFNQVPYGGSAWGVEAAAQIYFGKSSSELSLAESALLAGLPAAPSHFSPLGPYPQQAVNRQHEVLRRMVEENSISQEEADRAKEEPLTLSPQRTPIHAPHFVMYVKDLLMKKYGPRLVEQGGLRVITTLDLPLQEAVEEIVLSEVLKLAPLKVGNGAALVTDPKTGEILAMVGSKDYFDLEEDGNVNVTLSLQQPGSAIKVVTYAAALQNGFTAATILNDGPVSYRQPYQEPYSPVNYDGRFHGQVPLRYALGNSYNVPAVKTLAKIGVETMINQGERMGIESWEETSRYGLALTLGGGEVTMLDLARVYGTLANQGIRQELKPVLEVTNYEGRVVEKGLSPDGSRALSEETAFILSDILADNQARTAAFGANSLLNIPGKRVAVKTGTSNDLRDNWAIGFTPSSVVVVWVGNNDNSPMSRVASGITGATPIWHRITELLLEGQENESFPVPDGITKIQCRGREEYFIRGTEPSGGCPPLATPSPSATPSPVENAG